MSKRTIGLNPRELPIAPHHDAESNTSATKEKSFVVKARGSLKAPSLQTLVALLLGYCIGCSRFSHNSLRTTLRTTAAFTSVREKTRKENKRPLQIFPLLKELKTGWGNLQVGS
jgi:hypothetical protein